MHFLVSVWQADACRFSCGLWYAAVDMISESDVRSQSIDFSGQALSCYFALVKKRVYSLYSPALLHKCYAKLRLKVNETKSAVAGVTGRKFLGYSF